MSEHDDIKGSKTMAEIIGSLGDLVGMCLLFNRESAYYKVSGLVAATTFNEITEKSSITLCHPSTGAYLVTIAMDTRADLETVLSTCDAFVGATEEKSFLLAP